MKYWFNEDKSIRLYNDDCFNAMNKFIEKGVKVDCVVTDPPYGMNFISNYRKTKHNKIINDTNLDWLDEFSKNIYELMKDNSHGYVFCSFHNVDKFKQSLEKYFKIKNILIWEKNNTSMGDLRGDYAPKYEMIIYINKGRRILNGRRDSNILQFKRVANKFHPTTKPVDLLQFLIEKSTNKNELVFDCFMGGGEFGCSFKTI